MNHLYARGTIIGVRDGRSDRESGQLKTQIVDLYDPKSGPISVDIDVDDKGATIPVPPRGSDVTVRVSVRAYSGFVRNGAAGDARVIYKAVEFSPVEPAVKGIRKAG